MTENPNQDPADVIARHMPNQPAPPTYGGGFHPGGPVLARPNEPATRGQVNGLEGRVAELERWRDDQVSDDRDEPCETEGPAPTPADPADYGTEADARWHQGRADRLQRDRDGWRQNAEDRMAELADVRATLERTRAELGKPRLGCATTQQLIIELAARADVSATIGEKWPTYRTVDSDDTVPDER